jgi:hypothetical protein
VSVAGRRFRLRPSFAVFKRQRRLELGDTDILVSFRAKFLEEENRKADERYDKENGCQNQIRLIGASSRLVDELDHKVSAGTDADDTQ